jgi:5-methylcytosine-specific restriction endonuclease McrA
MTIFIDGLEVGSSREDAVSLKLKLYAGSPCKYGHGADSGINVRRVSCQSCNICSKIRISKWNKEGKHLPRKEKLSPNEVDSRRKIRLAKWYSENREEHSNRSKLWRVSNKDRKSDVDRDWKKRNPDRTRAHNSKRRAALRGASPYWLTDEHIAKKLEFYAEATRLERESGKSYHVDHIVPIANLGLDVPWNLQILEASENKIKGSITSQESVDRLWDETRKEFLYVSYSSGISEEESEFAWIKYRAEFMEKSLK